MEEIKTLIEDYKRRLNSITELISKQRSEGMIARQIREERLKTKASCYRTFITELERTLNNIGNDNN